MSMAQYELLIQEEVLRDKASIHNRLCEEEAAMPPGEERRKVNRRLRLDAHWLRYEAETLTRAWQTHVRAYQAAVQKVTTQAP